MWSIDHKTDELFDAVPVSPTDSSSTDSESEVKDDLILLKINYSKLVLIYESFMEIIHGKFFLIEYF